MVPSENRGKGARARAVAPGSERLPARMPARLLREFDECPVGHHGPELQRILNAVRGGALEGKYVLICTRPYSEWVLGRLSGNRGAPVDVLPEYRYSSIEDAERAVFRLRWHALTGQKLD